MSRGPLTILNEDGISEVVNDENPLAVDSRLTTLNKYGEYAPVSEGFGLGIREHDDVMLEYGYSRVTTKRFTIPAGYYSAITLTVPENLYHHAENRLVSTYNGDLELSIVIGKTAVDMVGTPSRMVAFNEVGPVVDSNVQSLFDYYAPASTIRVGGTVDETNSMIPTVLRASTGQGNRASSKDQFSELSGRTYLAGFYVVNMHNPTNADIEVEYTYAWHEY